MTTRILALCAGLLALGLAGSAQATLLGRLPSSASVTGYLAYYDTTTNLTWLENANVNGAMTWSAANAWAAGLNIDGVTGWALPSVTDTGAPGCDYAYSGTDCGYNVQTTSGSTVYSAMASMYYDTLGSLGYCDTSGNCPQTGYGLANNYVFASIQDGFYWSATEYATNTIGAWAFSFGDGTQGPFLKSDTHYAWAVHAGDVGAGVPEPGTVWLMGVGLVGLLGVRRRRLALR